MMRPSSPLKPDHDPVLPLHSSAMKTLEHDGDNYINRICYVIGSHDRDASRFFARWMDRMITAPKDASQCYSDADKKNIEGIVFKAFGLHPTSKSTRDGEWADYAINFQGTHGSMDAIVHQDLRGNDGNKMTVDRDASRETILEFLGFFNARVKDTLDKLQK